MNYIRKSLMVNKKKRKKTVPKKTAGKLTLSPPKLSIKEREKRSRDIINRAATLKSEVDHSNIKRMSLYIPEIHYQNLNKIKLIQGGTINSLIVDLLRLGIKKRLKQLNEESY